MPRANPLHGDFWGDPDVGDYDWFMKLLFLFLFSNAFSSKSGVYVCSVKFMHDGTGIPKDLIRHYLGIKPMQPEQVRAALHKAIDEMMIDAPPRLKNVMYDASTHTVFVRNMLARSLGGRPDKVALAIMGDHRRTYKSKELWEAWVKRYKNMLQDPRDKYYSADLEDYFNRALGKTVDGEIPEPIEPERPLPPKHTEPASADAEREIQRMLNRYSIETDQGGGLMWRLDEDDRDCVLRVLRHVTSHLRTGKPLAAKQRYEILRRLDKDPTMVVARGCFIFEDEGHIETGKRANYLFGICRNSALSWFVEWKRELEKSKEYKLGRGRKKKPKGRRKTT